MDCRVTPGNDRAEMGEGVACRLVPQGGFEPSTYRLRSDCSAVELLRRDQGALISAALCLGKARRQARICHDGWTRGAPASPPPLGGEGQGGGTQKDRACACTPSPTLPRKRGRERTEVVS